VSVVVKDLGLENQDIGPKLQGHVPEFQQQKKELNHTVTEN